LKTYGLALHSKHLTNPSIYIYALPVVRDAWWLFTNPLCWKKDNGQWPTDRGTRFKWEATDQVNSPLDCFNVRRLKQLKYSILFTPMHYMFS